MHPSSIIDSSTYFLNHFDSSQVHLIRCRSCNILLSQLVNLLDFLCVAFSFVCVMPMAICERVKTEKGWYATYCDIMILSPTLTQGQRRMPVIFSKSKDAFLWMQDKPLTWHTCLEKSDGWGVVAWREGMKIVLPGIQNKPIRAHSFFQSCFCYFCFLTFLHLVCKLENISISLTPKYSESLGEQAFT